MDAKFFDGLYEGDSPNGVKLGLGLTGGDFWSRVNGCSVLYRGLSMEAVDFESILTVVDSDSSQISPPSYLSHESNTAHFYIVRRVNNCGQSEHTLSAAVKVSIDSNGNLAQPRPNNIFEVKAHQISGDKIRLIWYYCPIDQESKPLCFKIYYDSGTGQINYENPVATISYLGRRFYSYQSGKLDAGTYLFTVRVEGVSGAQDSSFARITIPIDTTNPNALGILSTETL